MTDVLNSEKLSAIANGVKKHMASFSKDFLTLYSTAVVNAAIDGELEEDADKPKEQEEPEQEQQDGSAEENNNEEQEDDEDARQLLQRPEGDEGGDEPLYTATMTKRGQVRKNWKERFFVVRPDCIIDYYENEAKYKSGGKPKGTINLSAYTIYTEPNKRKQEEKRQLAENFGVSPQDDYSKYEPLTLECYHPIRRRWLIKCNDEEQFKQWADILKLCALKVDTGTLKDSLKKDAFAQAASNLSKKLDQTIVFGSEIDILTTMLANNAWTEEVGGDDAFKDIPGPAAVKAKACTKGFETVYFSVETAVKAAWAATQVAADKTRDLIKSTLADSLDSVRNAKESLTDKVTEAVSPAFAPVKDKVIVPVCSKLASFIIPQTREPISSAEGVLETETEVYCEERATGGNPSMRRIKYTDRVNGVVDAFDALNGVLTAQALLDILPEQVAANVENLQGALESIGLSTFVTNLRELTLENTERAAYTFEVTLEESTNGDHSKAQEQRELALAQVKEKYQHDARLDTIDAVTELVCNLLNILVGDKLTESCESAVEPLDSLVPEPMQEFLSIGGILSDVIANTFEEAASEAAKAAFA